MAAPVPNFTIAASRKSSGKTTISLGLARAFSNRGLRVQTFKKGPDYIDPLWLQQASRHPCYNLDFNTQSETEISNTFAENLNGVDLAIVETNKGLFDGLDLHGKDSNAQLVKVLKSPVILVIDTTGITRGIAPLLQGYAKFDPEIEIAGVILNKTAGDRHEGKLINAVEYYTDIPVLGSLRRDDNLAVTERHLGLTTPGEKSGVEPLLEKLAHTITNSVNLDAITDIAASSPAAPQTKAPVVDKSQTPAITIAIPRDEAFGFYYPDDLEALQRAGAKLEFFSAINDTNLPKADALFIGGGFPETHMAKLEVNTSLRQQINSAINNGMPTYAECGGLMYLARSISWQGKTAQMVGAIPGDCHMHEKPQGRGFARLNTTAGHPWMGKGNEYKVHEFHYADITGLPAETKYAYKVARGHGIDGNKDGIVMHNMLANFCHFRNTQATQWVTEFVGFVRKLKNGSK